MKKVVQPKFLTEKNLNKKETAQAVFLYLDKKFVCVIMILEVKCMIEPEKKPKPEKFKRLKNLCGALGELSLAFLENEYEKREPKKPKKIKLKEIKEADFDKYI